MLETNIPDKTKVLERTIKKAQEYLLGLQNEEGFWVGELEADASVTAGYISLMYFMTGKVDPEKKHKVINYARNKQNADGSWSTYYGGPGDLNVTTQVYFSLKLGGIPAEESLMKKAREFVLSKGGIMKGNTITRIWLAIFGQYDYSGTPSIPPEIALLPNWFYFNIYEFASWSRETIMALMLILAIRPVCKVPEYADVSELYIESKENRRYVPASWGKFISWRNFFLFVDYVFKALEKVPFKPFRKLAMKKVETWVVEHQEIDGSWGGIMLPWVYSLLALKSLGYTLENPVVKKSMEGLTPFIVEDSQTLRMQPATSPVWDTAWAVLALREAGTPLDNTSLVKAGEWLLKEEIRTSGDWKMKNPDTAPGGWAFEFENDFYPDIDDTAVVPRALLSLKLTETDELAKINAVRRGLRWIKEMQSSYGGWAAFDRDNNKRILANVPYADFMTPLDPTSADVTAHAIELISKIDTNDSSLKRAVEYLKRIQEPDGTWYGRWGVNYVYGTGLVLVSMKSAGENTDQKYIIKAVEWLESNQHQDGGWGETCETYKNPAARGRGPSTASQTAWALMGLIATGRQSSIAVIRGVEYLLHNQCEDGSWIENAYTGTGFPGTFYLRYDLYRIYFPLLVLGQYRNCWR